MASSLTSLLSLPQQLLGGLGGGGASKAGAAGGPSSGAGNIIGTVAQVALKLAPTVLGAIPIVGPFFSMFSQLGPLLGAVTGKSAVPSGAGASGQMDAATAAAMLEALKGSSGGGGGMSSITSPELHSQLSPTLHVTGGSAGAVQAAFTAIGAQSAGAQLMRTLAGSDINVVVLDDASYKKRIAEKSTPPGTIYLAAGGIANPRALTTALVNGLARAAKSPASA